MLELLKRRMLAQVSISNTDLGENVKYSKVWSTKYIAEQDDSLQETYSQIGMDGPQLGFFVRGAIKASYLHPGEVSYVPPPSHPTDRPRCSTCQPTNRPRRSTSQPNKSSLPQHFPSYTPQHFPAQR